MPKLIRARIILAALAAAASLGPWGCGWTDPPAAAPAQHAAAPRRALHALDRAAVIGASMSAGFGTATKLATVLDADVSGIHEPVASDTSWFFFISPSEHATGQLDTTLAENPTLVVGVDFLFWFGYGAVGADGKALASEDGRLELLEQGLKLCERVRCPLVIGDFPDMTPAVGGMLSKRQLPEPQTLAALNKRLYEWAKGRDNVIVIPLDQLVNDIRAGKTMKVGTHEFKPEQTARFMQEDKLHPSDEGLVAMTFLIADELQKKQLATAQDFAADPEAVLRRIRPQTPAAPADAPAKQAP